VCFFISVLNLNFFNEDLPVSKDGPANTARYRACLSSTLTIRNGVAERARTIACV